VKKLIFILLLTLLPLQFSWAAVSMYCQHEQGKATQHIGHHLHKHEAAAGAQDNQDSPSKVHNDCGYCHLACQATLMTDAPQVMKLPQATHIERPSFSYSSHIPDGPRRPDRFPVA
jgi:hypothetical protein